MNTTLVVMAAGIGSRFGKGIKQLFALGPNGELIIDYSVHDALEAGFNKVVFIIRKEIESDFKSIIGDRLQKALNCEIHYVFQDIADIPQPFSVPDGRTKPWGTGQAVLACKGIVKEPFCVINADDYYGKEAFLKIHEFLAANEHSINRYCMAGFVLGNTLSANGGVTRGLCQLDGDSLTGVVETRGIRKTSDGAEANGQSLDIKSHVSMNMWGLTPDFMEWLDGGFNEFLANLGENGLGAEFLLPNVIDQLIRDSRISVTMLESNDRWFGITYSEDAESVRKEFQKLVSKGVYCSPLFTN